MPDTSAYRATPMRLFIFSMGTTTWRLASGTSQTYQGAEADFLPDAALDMGEIDQQLAEASASVEIRISSAHPVAQQFVPFLPPEPIQVRVLRLNYRDAPGDRLAEFVGEVVSASFAEADGVCTLTCRMVSAAMSRIVPWCRHSSNCANALYGPGCRVDPAAFQTTAPLDAGAGTAQISAGAFLTAAADHGATDPDVVAGWFRNGYVRHLATGEVRTILGQDGASLILNAPFTRAANGDPVQALAGCDGDRVTCRVKFDNLDNMLAFPWVPGRNPYAQSVYGNKKSPLSGFSVNIGGLFGRGKAVTFEE